MGKFNHKRQGITRDFLLKSVIYSTFLLKNGNIVQLRLAGIHPDDS